MASEPTRTAESTGAAHTRLIALLITTLEVLAVIAGLAVIAYFGTHSDCNGYWGFNEHGTYVCQRAIE